jgi:hypothetical protein
MCPITCPQSPFPVRAWDAGAACLSELKATGLGPAQQSHRHHRGQPDCIPTDCNHDPKAGCCRSTARHGLRCRQQLKGRSMSLRATAEAAQASWGRPSSMPASPAAVAGRRVGIVRIASISLACATDNGRRLNRQAASLANPVEHEHPTPGLGGARHSVDTHTHAARAARRARPRCACRGAAPHRKALSYVVRWWQLSPAPQQQGEQGGPPGGAARGRGRPGAGPAGGCRGRCAVLALPPAAAAPCTARPWGSCPWGRPWRG